MVTAWVQVSRLIAWICIVAPTDEIRGICTRIQCTVYICEGVSPPSGVSSMAIYMWLFLNYDIKYTLI